MPALEQMDLNQLAVRWTRNGTNSYGRPTISLPGVELAVRWNDKLGQMRDKDGNVVAYDGFVITDRALAIGDMLWLGAIASLPGTGLPAGNLMEVIQYNMTKSLDGRNTRHESMVKRYTDVLPTA